MRLRYKWLTQVRGFVIQNGFESEKRYFILDPVSDMEPMGLLLLFLLNRYLQRAN